GRDARLLEQPPALLFARAGHAHHQRQGEVEIARGIDDAVCHLVATGDAAKNVDQDALDVRVARQQLERAVHHLGLHATADIEEVGCTAAFALHQVERVHHQPGAVTDHTDGAVETHIGEL